MAHLVFTNKPDNPPIKEGIVKIPLPGGPEKACPNCHRTLYVKDLKAALYTCPCGYNFPYPVRERIDLIFDKDSFTELFSNLTSGDPLSFPEYKEKLAKAKKNSGEKEAVLTGEAKIDGQRVAVFLMNQAFMMGSMGSACGEKITRLFEYATERSLPVIGFTASGGARMQEGLLSLMQMAKTSGSVKRHSDKGLLYITFLTNPTTGGVTASFAMEGDIILCEPGATVGFAGARVIEQTLGRSLPKGFQRAEFLLDHGFCDAIVERKDEREILSYLVRLHSKERPV